MNRQSDHPAAQGMQLSTMSCHIYWSFCRAAQERGQPVDAPEAWCQAASSQTPPVAFCSGNGALVVTLGPREAVRHLGLARLSGSCSTASGSRAHIPGWLPAGVRGEEASKVVGQDLRRAMLQHGVFQGNLQEREMPSCL